MSKSRVLVFLALVLLAALPVGLARAQEADAVGTAVIWDDEKLSDAITYSLTNVAPPGSGREYVGWLVSDDGSIKLSTGPMTVEADGSVSHTFDHTSKRYTGENLIHVYNKVVVTDEAAGADPDAPAGLAVYSHEIPSGGITHIRHLLTNWPPGTDKGILTNLKGQLAVALVHATLSKNSATAEDVIKHAHHVINIIEGEDGPNFDSSFGNPGDGIGVLNHAVDSKHADFASKAVPDDDVMAAHAALVDITAIHTADLATEARDIALNRVLPVAESDIRLAHIMLGPGGGTVISTLEAALDGFDANVNGTIASDAVEGGADQAYVEAQLMATYTLTPGAPPAPPTPVPQNPTPIPQNPTPIPPTPTPTPVPPTPVPVPTQAPSLGLGLPSVGGSAIESFAPFALVSGLVLLVAGGLIFIRGRRSRNSA